MLIFVGCSEEEAESAKQNCRASGSTIIGTQGCLPEFYPQVMDMVISRRFIIGPFVLTRPMSWIREFFMELPKSPGDILLVLTTDDFGLDYTWEPKSCR
jgi:6-hydroxycyclohex-1-ene-1-carbonyl-CoA dehydrogenase